MFPFLFPLFLFTVIVIERKGKLLYLSEAVLKIYIYGLLVRSCGGIVRPEFYRRKVYDGKIPIAAKLKNVYYSLYILKLLFRTKGISIFAMSSLEERRTWLPALP